VKKKDTESALLLAWLMLFALRIIPSQTIIHFHPGFLLETQLAIFITPAIMADTAQLRKDVKVSDDEMKEKPEEGEVQESDGNKSRSNSPVGKGSRKGSGSRSRSMSRSRSQSLGKRRGRFRDSRDRSRDRSFSPSPSRSYSRRRSRSPPSRDNRRRERSFSLSPIREKGYQPKGFSRTTRGFVKELPDHVNRNYNPGRNASSNWSNGRAHRLVRPLWSHLWSLIMIGPLLLLAHLDLPLELPCIIIIIIIIILGYRLPSAHSKMFAPNFIVRRL